LLIAVRKNLSAFLLRKMSVCTHHIPASRASRDNTLHLASKVVCQRVAPLASPDILKWVPILIYQQNKAVQSILLSDDCTALFCGSVCFAAGANMTRIFQKCSHVFVSEEVGDSGFMKNFEGESTGYFGILWILLV